MLSEKEKALGGCLYLLAGFADEYVLDNSDRFSQDFAKTLYESNTTEKDREEIHEEFLLRLKHGPGVPENNH